MATPLMFNEVQTEPTGALFAGDGGMSDDNCYRVLLWRHTNAVNPARDWAVFIGLNPSTADAHQDDPTIRRCVAFARRWGARVMVMLNLYAYRATDPKDLHTWIALRTAAEMRRESDENMAAIRGVLDGTNSFCVDDAPIILAWGAHGAKLDGRRHRVEQLVWAYTQAQCLGVTKSGEPKHPLYLPVSTPYVPFVRKAVCGWRP